MVSGAGEVLGKADIPATVQAVADVARAAGATSPVDELETVLNVATRFAGLLERVVGSVQTLRGIEAEGQGQGQGQAVPELVGGPPVVAAAPIPPAAPKVSPLKVYQAALGVLSQLPETLTVADVLKYARDNKTMILAVLESKIPELQE